jgi:hypothetical protein
MTSRRLNTNQRIGDKALFVFFAAIFAAIISHV